MTSRQILIRSCAFRAAVGTAPAITPTTAPMASRTTAPAEKKPCRFSSSLVANPLRRIVARSVNSEVSVTRVREVSRGSVAQQPPDLVVGQFGEQRLAHGGGMEVGLRARPV